MTTQFGGTVLYVDVSSVVDFYRRAFGLELRFFDEAPGFAELETGGFTLAIAAHSLGKMSMPNRYLRPADGRPAGIEIAFLTHDVSAFLPKRSPRARRRLRHQGECRGALRSLMSGLQKVRSLVSLNRRPLRLNEDHTT